MLQDSPKYRIYKGLAVIRALFGLNKKKPNEVGFSSLIAIYLQYLRQYNVKNQSCAHDNFEMVLMMLILTVCFFVYNCKFVLINTKNDQIKSKIIKYHTEIPVHVFFIKQLIFLQDSSDQTLPTQLVLMPQQI